MCELICVYGATSTGKSDLAVYIAREFDGEVISADSMQVYRGLDIGTGKVSTEEMQGIPHHLLDCCDPAEKFSAGMFQKSADSIVADIQSRGKTPIVAGGTGLYFRALLQGLAPVGPVDPKLRKRLKDRCEVLGVERMYRLLGRLDPPSAARLPVNDSQRILRAMEYRIGTGRRLSDTIAKQPFTNERYQALKIGIRVERSLLRDRIDRRVDRMIEAGWPDEVKRLLESGVAADSQGLSAIGYRELIKYLNKEVKLGEATELIKISTHQYAKRQETWFRKEKNVTWFEADSLDETKPEVKKFILGNYNERRRNEEKNGSQ